MRQKFARTVVIIFVAIVILLVFEPGIEHRPQSLFVGIALLLAAMGSLISYYEYRGIGSQEGILRRLPGVDEKVVALTFDDGPSPIYTPKILDVLKEHGVKATFFVTGRHAEKYPDIMRRMVAEGHDVGNHAYSHANMVLLNEKQLTREISRAERAIRETTGRTTTLFRPPRGLYNRRVRKRLLDEGYSIVLWSVSSMDWSFFGARAIAWRVRYFARNGSIILLHDSGSLVRREGGSRRSTVASLPMMIKSLKEREYRLVSVSELMELHEEARLDEATEV